MIYATLAKTIPSHTLRRECGAEISQTLWRSGWVDGQGRGVTAPLFIKLLQQRDGKEEEAGELVFACASQYLITAGAPLPPRLKKPISYLSYTVCTIQSLVMRSSIVTKVQTVLDPVPTQINLPSTCHGISVSPLVAAYCLSFEFEEVILTGLTK